MSGRDCAQIGAQETKLAYASVGPDLEGFVALIWRGKREKCQRMILFHPISRGRGERKAKDDTSQANSQSNLRVRGRGVLSCRTGCDCNFPVNPEPQEEWT